MAKRIMVDTSGIYALLDRSDANHGPAVALVRRLKDEGHGVAVTNFIFDPVGRRTAAGRRVV